MSWLWTAPSEAGEAPPRCCFADAWVNLGTVREEQQDPVRARGCYVKALSARPDCPEALFNLGLLLTSRGKYDEALPLWERYMALSVIPDQFQRGRRLKKLCELELYVQRRRGADRLESLLAVS